MEKKEFLKTINFYRRKLNRAKFLEVLVVALMVGAGVGILFQMISFVTPFYYANQFSVWANLVAVFTTLVYVLLKPFSMKDAALTMDKFGFNERIVTAYEHMDEDGTVIKLQRKDAMERLHRQKENIRITILPPVKRLVTMCSLLVLMLILMLLPSDTKERAKALHQITEIAEEKQDEVEDVLEELEKLANEPLTEEQLATLQEMMESLQATMQEYELAGNMEEIDTATRKLEYKYGNMSDMLMNMAQVLESGAGISPMSQQAMKELAEQMQQMSDNPNLASGQGTQGSNGQNGMNSDGQNNPNGQDGSQGNDGQGNGQGNGQGSGDDQGSDSGNGKGNGGQGDGSGNGRGEGSSNTVHDYVSIPNAIADSGLLSGDVQNHENSDYFKTQNGISWEGKHISYEEVIGKYRQNAYEGISKGQYPSGMEDIIKNYFSSFN